MTYYADTLDPDKDYLIIVPVNETGVEELYCNDIFKDDYISNNLKYMVFHEEMYVYMEGRLFDIINVEMNTLINMYEEEIIDNDGLNELLSIAEMVMRNTDDEKALNFMREFLNLVHIAIAQHTVVGFCF